MKEKNAVREPSTYERVCRIMDGLNLSRRILDMEDEGGVSFRARITLSRNEDDLTLYKAYPKVLVAHILEEVVAGEAAFNPDEFATEAERDQQTAEVVDSAREIQADLEASMAVSLR